MPRKQRPIVNVYSPPDEGEPAYILFNAAGALEMMQALVAAVTPGNNATGEMNIFTSDGITGKVYLLCHKGATRGLAKPYTAPEVRESRKCAVFPEEILKHTSAKVAREARKVWKSVKPILFNSI